MNLFYQQYLNQLTNESTSAAMLNKGWWVSSPSKLNGASGETPSLSRALFTFSISPCLIALNNFSSMTKENSFSIFYILQKKRVT